MRQLQDPRKPAAQRHPLAARHAAVETGGVAKVPLLPQGPLRAAGAHDQADRDAGDHAVQVGASNGGAVIAAEPCAILSDGMHSSIRIRSATSLSFLPTGIAWHVRNVFVSSVATPAFHTNTFGRIGSKTISRRT